MAPGDDCMCGGILGLQLDRLAKQAQRFVSILRHRGKRVGQGTEIKVIGGEIVRPLAPCALDLALPELRLDDAGDTDCDVVLKLKNVFEKAVEPVGPEMRAACYVDQL